MSATAMYVVTRKGLLAPIASLRVWATWFEDVKGRTIAKHLIGRAVVSTVLDGIDSGDGKLYVSLVGGGRMDGVGERYATRDEALAGHERLCAWVRSAESNEDTCQGK